MTERVTVEQNGERFTLEVPDGTPDEEIQRFLQQQQGIPASLTETGPDLTKPGAMYATGVAVPEARAALGTAAHIAQRVGEMTPQQATQIVTHPLATVRNVIEGAVEGFTPKVTTSTPVGPPELGLKEITTRSARLGEIARHAPAAIGRGMMALAASPEAILSLPYAATAYEMEKIRANPQAYPNVPYAQVVRGEQPTIGAAGAANRRQAIYNTPSSYQPTAEEAQNILASGDERMMRIYGGRDALTEMIRRKAAQKVLAQ